MMDDRPGDLAGLTLAAAHAMVGEDFIRDNESGPDVVLQLTKAEAGSLDPSAQPVASGRPFSILFKGPGDPQLTQGMHDLEHPAHPLIGIFLVPVGQDEDGLIYEAVFS